MPAEKTHLERTLETLVDLVDLARKSSDTKFERLESSLDKLTLQVAQLTTQQKQTAQNIERLAQTLEGHLLLSQSQSANIAELTKLATVLASR
jgi:hypothetical protein